MTIKAFERGFAFRMTFDAEPHVDFVNRNYAVHRFDWTVTSLAADVGGDVGPMRETHEIRQCVHPVPSNLERRLTMVGPGPGNRLDSAQQCRPMASDASLDRGDARCLGAASVFVAVLTRDFVYSGVNSMAERYGLDHVGAWCPRPLGKSHDAQPAEQEHSGKRKEYPVHVQKTGEARICRRSANRACGQPPASDTGPNFPPRLNGPASSRLDPKSTAAGGECRTNRCVRY